MRNSLLVLSLVMTVVLSADTPGVGKVAFANSGDAAAQDAFLRGLALLHNFEYDRAASAFAEAQKIDPAFAMAYWGEAMTHTHPIWFQQDREAALDVLRRLGTTTEERLAKAKTERERDYLRTLDVLYGEGSKNERDFLYAEAMAALHAKYPDDVDAAAFHALAVLGTAHQGRDFATYMRAAAILEEVFPANRNHPGVLHYLIHSYDDPVHAPLGMRAARLYGAVAPDAGHALHMTSHIFVAMGMWDDVIDANRRAIDVVNRLRAARSRPPAHCGHYPTWLHYGLLQKGEHDAARAALDACHASAFAAEFVSGGPMDSRSGRLAEYAEMRAQQLAAGNALTGPHVTPELPDGETRSARLLIAYGDALAAAQKNNAAALAAATARLRDVRAQREDNDNPAWRIREEVMLQEAEALALVVAGKREEAIAILRKAADAERTMPLEFGPPLVPKPAAELLAEQLAAAGRASEAAAAYELVLARAPGRTRAAQGLASVAGAVKRDEKSVAGHVH